MLAFLITRLHKTCHGLDFYWLLDDFYVRWLTWRCHTLSWRILSSVFWYEDEKLLLLSYRFWLLSQKFVCLTDEISVINVMIYCMLLKLFTLIMPTNESFDIHRIYGQETRPQKITRWIFTKKKVARGKIVLMVKCSNCWLQASHGLGPLKLAEKSKVGPQSSHISNNFIILCNEFFMPFCFLIGFKIVRDLDVFWSDSKSNRVFKKEMRKNN